MASLRSVGLLVVAAFLITVSVLTSRPAASAADVVSLADGSVISLRTPEFIQVGKRYAFTWAGGGPPSSHVVKSKRADGWVLVEVADENLDPRFYVPGELPTRWLNAGTAISIQELRVLPY